MVLDKVAQEGHPNVAHEVSLLDGALGYANHRNNLVYQKYTLLWLIRCQWPYSCSGKTFLKLLSTLRSRRYWKQDHNKETLEIRHRKYQRIPRGSEELHPVSTPLDNKHKANGVIIGYPFHGRGWRKKKTPEAGVVFEILWMSSLK